MSQTQSPPPASVDELAALNAALSAHHQSQLLEAARFLLACARYHDGVDRHHLCDAE